MEFKDFCFGIFLTVYECKGSCNEHFAVALSCSYQILFFSVALRCKRISDLHSHTSFPFVFLVLVVFISITSFFAIIITLYFLLLKKENQYCIP